MGARLLGPLLGLLLVACGDGPSRPGPPNVVLIVADDMGYADLGIHGSDTFRTPRIDSIARDGVRFENGYVASPLCSPSRAALLTGRYPQRFGHEFNPPRLIADENAGLPQSEVTLARMLRSRGYRTIGIGKWHLGSSRRFHPMERGFDHFYGFLKGMRRYRPSPGVLPARALTRDGRLVPETFEYLTDEFGREAADAVARNRDVPFFLYVSFSAVHSPLQAKPEVLARVPETVPEPRRTLVAMTVSLDEAVGTILDALEAHGLSDETLVFFLNDNGGAGGNASSNAPLRGGKTTLFEGGIRVPFFLRWPGVVPAGRVYPHPVSSLDVVPTVLAAAGASAPPQSPLDGVDLAPYLTGERAEPAHATLHWRMGRSWAIRDGAWKLVTHPGGRPMLFQLDDDPSESIDLASRQPERVLALEQRHREWAASLRAPLWKFQLGEPAWSRE